MKRTENWTIFIMKFLKSDNINRDYIKRLLLYLLILMIKTK